MATSFPRRLLRGLRWAFLGWPAAPRIGRLDRPRVLYVEATVVTPETVASLEGHPASWVKVQLLEIAGSPYRATFDALRQAVAPREGRGPGVRYEVVGEIVRGHDLALETTDGEPLLLRAGTFDLARPDLRPTMRLEALPPELRGAWPGGANEQRFSRELILRHDAEPVDA